MPKEFSVNSYIDEIKEVAQHGHKDASTENLLLAFVELHCEQAGIVEQFLSYFLQRAQDNHLEITPRAFRLSLLTAIKLYLRLQGVKDYEYFSVRQWKQVIFECLNGLDEEFIRYCLRDVSTVKIYRYIALQIVGSLIAGSHRNPSQTKGLCILDGGCSINIGLKCLNALNLFSAVKIAPEVLEGIGGALSTFPLQYARGIDKYPPSLERTLASLFPSEVKQWETLYTRLYYSKKRKVHYRQQDILYLNAHEEYRQAFNLVFLSSLLRRFTPHQIAEVLVQVNYATCRHSFLVINEQFSRDTIEGGGKYATFVLPKYMLERLSQQSYKAIDLYDLLNIAFQLLIYPDENCQNVLPGEDFHAFLWLCASPDPSLQQTGKQTT